MVASLITAVVALILTILQFRSWGQKGKISLFWWGFAFLITALASGSQFLSYVLGRSGPLYRLYLITAAAIPAFFGVGTAYLLFSRLFANIFLAINALVSLVMVYFAVVTPVSLTGLKATEATAAAQNAPPILTAFFGVLGGLGAIVLVVGAFYSWWRRRKPSTLLIALGGLVFSLGGTMAGLGIPVLFYVTEVLGILILFLGVLSSR